MSAWNQKSIQYNPREADVLLEKIALVMPPLQVTQELEQAAQRVFGGEGREAIVEQLYELDADNPELDIVLAMLAKPVLWPQKTRITQNALNLLDSLRGKQRLLTPGVWTTLRHRLGERDAILAGNPSLEETLDTALMKLVNAPREGTGPNNAFVLRDSMYTRLRALMERFMDWDKGAYSVGVVFGKNFARTGLFVDRVMVPVLEWVLNNSDTSNRNWYSKVWATETLARQFLDAAFAAGCVWPAAQRFLDPVLTNYAVFLQENHSTRPAVCNIVRGSVRDLLQWIWQQLAKDTHQNLTKWIEDTLPKSSTTLMVLGVLGVPRPDFAKGSDAERLLSAPVRTPGDNARVLFLKSMAHFREAPLDPFYRE